ncbi:MAG: NUDIX domain-containing protein [Parvibaculum sp.]|uniref:NUDIX domain-containing protein n=1 Tax=Parvibaculum sp. TaxID=2024848 RepID=UPI0025F51020|nr:NUDIX domain-containing protein [Parvibaculum sp.]MCE9649331.1 NUDIX domain-containing protein [Parvibaculum sp.]
MSDIACALFVRDGKILLARRAPDRDKYPGCWDLPGGHAENGDSVEDALVRETREEMGVTPRRYTKIAEIPEPRVSDYGPATYHIFLVRSWEGEHWLKDGEHTMFDWFTTDEAASLPDLELDGLRPLFRALT